MKTKELIIRSAFELFLKQGYNKASMAQIATEVGIKKASLYYYFKSKEELAVSVIDYFEEKMEIWNKKNNQNINSFKDFIKAMIMAIPVFNKIEDVILDKPISSEVSIGFNDFVANVSKFNPEVKTKIKKIFDKTHLAVENSIIIAQKSGIVNKKLNPKIMALILHSIVEGAGIISNFDDSLNANVFEQIFTQIWQILTNE